MLFCVCILLFNKMPLRVNHILLCGSSFFFLFCCCLGLYCLIIPLLFIRFAADGHLNYFHFGTIINKAATFFYLAFCEHVTSVLFGIHLGLESFGSHGKHMFSFSKYCPIVFQSFHFCSLQQFSLASHHHQYLILSVILVLVILVHV